MWTMWTTIRPWQMLWSRQEGRTRTPICWWSVRRRGSWGALCRCARRRGRMTMVSWIRQRSGNFWSRAGGSMTCRWTGHRRRRSSLTSVSWSGKTGKTLRRANISCFRENITIWCRSHRLLKGRSWMHTHIGICCPYREHRVWKGLCSGHWTGRAATFTTRRRSRGSVRRQKILTRRRNLCA